jgi:hypothetical protein
MSREEKIEQLLARWEEFREQGQEVSAEELVAESPDLLADLKSQIQRLKAMEWLDSPIVETTASANGQGRSRLVIPATVGGRYRLERLIAEGGFGQVWRATRKALSTGTSNLLTSFWRRTAGPCWPISASL